MITAAKQANHIQRDPLVLMNKYYWLKEKNPEAAKKALLIILEQDKYYLPALKESTQSNLFNNQPQQKLIFLKRLHEQLPQKNEYTYQLAYLYYQTGDRAQAKLLFMSLRDHVSGKLKIKAEEGLRAMASYVPYYQYHTHVEYLTAPDRSSAIQKIVVTSHPVSIRIEKLTSPKSSHLVSSLDQFYRVKDKDSPSANRLIYQLLQKQPKDVLTLKEAGYLAIRQGRTRDAIDYFSRAYAITHQYDLALQLAYLYEHLHETRAACHYFNIATHSLEKNQSLLAENALTHLVGQQTKVLPKPYFSEFYLNPFTQSRFGLSVLPLILRAGIEQRDRFNTKEYVFLRRTQDNRSSNLGVISQIYEDNVQILGVGVQATPFRRFPLIGFIEAGDAYDLVYQNRNRWRGDLRGGFMYYQDFGAMPGYFDQWKFSLDYYSDWYADITYFSRYNNNVIGLIRTHQGIRLFQYKSSMLNLYLTGRVIEDTKRLFFNNIAEIGPGISIVPSNRFNVQVRLEQVNGMYLPAGATVNPYSKYYTNQLVQLLFYMKF